MPLAVNYYVNSQQGEKGLCAPTGASLLRVRFSLPPRLSPKPVLHGRRRQHAWGRCRCPQLPVTLQFACLESLLCRHRSCLPGIWGGGWAVCGDRSSLGVLSMSLWGIAPRFGLCSLEECGFLNLAVS